MLAISRSLRHRAAHSLVLLSLVAPATSQGIDHSVKLNEPLETRASAGVVEGRISPSGRWVVYLAAQDSGFPGLFSAPVDGSGPTRRLAPADVGPATVWETSARGELVYTNWRRLYVVPLDGSRAPFALTQLEDDGPIGTFQVSADGTRVVYRTADALTEFRSVRTDGSAPSVHLFGPGVASFALDPQGEHVAFVTGNAGVYVAPVDGGTVAARINGADAYVPHYLPLLFSPDGERLLYCARRGSNSDELWSARVDGSLPAVKLNAPLQPSGNVDGYAISADGTRVLYLADQEVNGRPELYSVPFDASQPPLKLNGNTGGVRPGFVFDAGGRRALFLSDEQPSASREYELYHAATDGSAPTRLLLPPILNPWTGDPSFALARPSRRVVYLSLQNGFVDIYSVPLGRGETRRLTQTNDPVGGPQSGGQLTPDGRTFVYLDRVAAGDEYELEAVPVDGSSAPRVVGGPFHLGRQPASALQISPDGKHVVVFVRSVDTELPELHAVPLDGHRPLARIHAPLVTEAVVDDVKSFGVSPDGSRAVFTVRVHDDPYDEQEQLYSVPLPPGAQPTLLHLTNHYNSIGLLQQRGGNAVFVERIGDSEPDYALRSVPLDGSGSAVTLVQTDGVNIPFHVTPDGSRVVFTEYEYEVVDGRIRSVPTTGGPAIPLSDAPVEGGNILNSRLSPDGARVVYAADALIDEVIELFSAPVDGSAPAVRLNAPFVAGGDVLTSFSYTDATGYAISPDGSTVVYLADQDVNGRFELYRVPIDGSAAPVRQSGVLPNTSDVEPNFRISADGQWIVYVADAIPGTNELFAGPLDGSSPPVRINTPLVAGRDVEDDFQLDPVHARAVYRADQIVDTELQLFSVALDGSESAVQLDGEPGSERDVNTGFVVAPDGAHVLFSTGSERRAKLFSAALGVAHSAVKLAGDPAVGREVLDGFRFSADGALALFAGDLEIDERFELWAAPAEGGKPWRVSGPLVPGGDVVRPAFLPWEFVPPVFEPVPGQESVVYLADQDDDEVLELYLGRLDRPRTTSLSGESVPRRSP